MIRNRTGRAAALAAALLFSGCVATKRDVRDMRTEMARLTARQDSVLMALGRQSATTQDTLRAQADQLFEIRGDVARQLQTILQELTELQELVGQNQRTIAALRDQLERRAAPVVVAPAPTPGAGAGESVLGAQTGGDAEEMYQGAVAIYQRGQLNTARRSFEEFLEEYGNHARAPDVRFYLGDVLEQQDQTQAALDAFNKIPELHPDSPRVGDALYRMALLDLELNKRTEARTLLERVVNSYPDSDSAGPAREKLRELR